MNAQETESMLLLSILVYHCTVSIDLFEVCFIFQACHFNADLYKDVCSRTAFQFGSYLCKKEEDLAHLKKMHFMFDFIFIHQKCLIC